MAFYDDGPTTWAGSPQNTSFINMFTNYWSGGGYLIDIIQGTTPSNGTILFMATGGGGGTFTGNFEQYLNGGVIKWQIDSNGNISAAGQVVMGSAPGSASAGQIAYGNQTVASSNCGTLASSTGCLKIFVGNTARYIPFY
jgi:hypothetical protein